MNARHLPIEALSAAAFQPFGEVIEAREGVQTFDINQGFAKRFHDLARIDVAEHGGAVCVSIFQALPRALPLRLAVMERHPLGSQAFVAMHQRPFLVVVAPGGTALDLDRLRCFRADRGQGVNYAKGTWHHPLIALDAPGEFLVIDRSGPAQPGNLEEVNIHGESLWVGR
jgi:ureidoglycolate lyase